MMTDAAFITAPQCLIPGEAIRFWHCRFDPGLYRPGDEQSLGIRLPEKFASALAKRKAEYIAGRHCAMAAMKAAGLEAVPPGYNSDRSPQWPGSVQGSISHSDGVAIAAVSTRHYIGIDLETRINADTAASVAGMIMTATERQQFGERPDPQRLTLIFSLKESFYKAAYPQVGRFFDFSAVSVLGLDPAMQQIRFRLEQSLSVALREGDELVADWLQLPGNQYLTWVSLPRD